MPPRKSCSAGVKNEIPSRKQSSRSPENHDDLKTNKLRSTIPLMDLIPPSLPNLPLLIFKALSEIHESFLISNFGLEDKVVLKVFQTKSIIL